MKINELYPDVLTEDNKYEFKAKLNEEEPVKWAKTIVGFANGNGGFLFVGVSNDRVAFGLTLDEIDRTKNLITQVNDRHIYPHAKLTYVMRSVDPEAEHFVLAIRVYPADSVVRYRDGDFNETVYIKGDGNTTPATPEEIISLSKRKFGVDNETTDIVFDSSEWKNYFQLCEEYRDDRKAPSLKELQNEEIVTKDGYVKSGLLMFKDDYHSDDTLICCRLWKGKTKTGIVLDNERFAGPLSQVFRDTIRFVERNTKIGWRKLSDGGREEIRAYPREAVREALVNAIAHRDYSIPGTQIDVDIYDDRMDIVSPGSWLLPKGYEEYPLGSIPSIRRNAIIAACLDIANLMERGGTGFLAMIESYQDCEKERQPGVLIYPGFLDLRLFDKLYEDYDAQNELSDKDKVIELLKDGPKTVKELQSVTKYKSRSTFLEKVLNPLINTGTVYRDGDEKSPSTRIVMKQQNQ